MTPQKRYRYSGMAVIVALLALGPCEHTDVQARTAHGVQMPEFQLAPGWPTIPNGWTLGQVSDVAVDSQDHIWILQRPRTVKPGVSTGPPVMIFDQDGKYIRGWGGPGPGYEWPQTEHGIFIDYKGNVWICGSGRDDQVLKFTNDGRFIMQLGQHGHKKTNIDTDAFWMPTDAFVYPGTNEVFISDGYGNKRIIVFDADTGKFKRMWGAFGNAPSDMPESSLVAQMSGRRIVTPNRTLATQFDPNDPGPPQFDTVHDVKISSDGFVYVADRGGKRVQIFTIAGKYVAQVWVDRWCEQAGEGCGNGQTAASVAFSADPEQRFLYVGSRSPARIWVFDRKSLRPLESFGRPGIGPGEFDALHEMATDSHGNLYVTEVEDGRRVQRFSFDGLVSAIPAATPATVVVNRAAYFGAR